VDPDPYSKLGSGSSNSRILIQYRSVSETLQYSVGARMNTNLLHLRNIPIIFTNPAYCGKYFKGYMNYRMSYLAPNPQWFSAANKNTRFFYIIFRAVTHLLEVWRLLPGSWKPLMKVSGKHEANLVTTKFQSFLFFPLNILNIFGQAIVPISVRIHIHVHP